MPRIAAALAVVLTVAFCIGFNTIRYPVVWAMTAGAGQTAASASAAISPSSPLAQAESGAISDSSADTVHESSSRVVKSADTTGEKSIRPHGGWNADKKAADQEESPKLGSKDGSARPPSGARGKLASRQAPPARKKPQPIAASISIPGDPVPAQKLDEDFQSADNYDADGWIAGLPAEPAPPEVVEKPPKTVPTSGDHKAEPVAGGKRLEETKTPKRPARKGRTTNPAKPHATSVGKEQDQEDSDRLRDPLDDRAVETANQDGSKPDVSQEDSAIHDSDFPAVSNFQPKQDANRQENNSADDAVRRLPPIDQLGGNPHGSPSGLALGESVPIYPSTDKGW